MLFSYLSFAGMFEETDAVLCFVDLFKCFGFLVEGLE